MKLLVIGSLMLVLAGTATATTSSTPRERALARQVTVLKAQARQLRLTNARLVSQRDAARDERDALRSIIINDVHSLATAWRNDGDDKTGVSYYESGGNYWSYSFTWCGFC